MRITVRNLRRKASHLSKVIWDRKIITEFTRSISSTRIGKPILMMDIKVSRDKNISRWVDLENLRNIHTTGNSCRDALPCANMALKLSQYFYLLIEKPLGRYFQVQSLYYQPAQCNQKTPIPISSRWQVRYEKAKKRISINTNHSYHQRLSS